MCVSFYFEGGVSGGAEGSCRTYTEAAAVLTRETWSKPTTRPSCVTAVELESEEFPTAAAASMPTCCWLSD
jgi:hypothetical protein